MIEVKERPRCMCGVGNWRFEMGQISTGPLAVGSQFFHCPACERIAAQHGIENSCVQVFIISRASCGKTEGFNDKVAIWVKNEVQNVIDEACQVDAHNAPISISDPDPDNYVVYVPNDRGSWIEVK